MKISLQTKAEVPNFPLQMEPKSLEPNPPKTTEREEKREEKKKRRSMK